MCCGHTLGGRANGENTPGTVGMTGPSRTGRYRSQPGKASISDADAAWRPRRVHGCLPGSGEGEPRGCPWGGSWALPGSTNRTAGMPEGKKQPTCASSCAGFARKEGSPGGTGQISVAGQTTKDQTRLYGSPQDGRNPAGVIDLRPGADARRAGTCRQRWQGGVPRAPAGTTAIPGRCPSATRTRVFPRYTNSSCRRAG